MARGKHKYLVASGSVGGSHVAIPFAIEARKAGHEVIVVSDGRAADHFEDAGFRLYFKGTLNFTGEPFTLDAMAVLEKQKPDAVVATRGGPTYIESCFDQPANALGIPLVLAEDWWANCFLCQGRPNLILVADKIGAELAEWHISGVETAVVGNHAVKSARDLAVPSAVEREISRLKKRFGTMIFFAGGGYETADVITFFKKCLAMTPSSCAVIPRFHPSYFFLSAPSGKTYGEEWKASFGEIGDRVSYVEAPSGEVLAKAADVTVANWSTLLTVAAASGKQAISLLTREERDTYKERFPRGFPLVLMGLAADVAKPCDLSRYFNKRPPKKFVTRWLKPYKPALALAAVERLVEKRR